MNDTHHILIAEDERPLLEGLSDLLTLKGFEVTGAHNGKVALHKLQDMPTPPDLIISDIYMPIMDGYTFLENVRARPEWLAIPFIFLTAKGERADIHQGLVLGAEDYVTKPFDFDELVMRIRSRLARKQEMLSVQESRIETIRKQILTVINHELRTPLSYIVAYTDLLAGSETAEKSEELQQYTRGILTGTERLSRLVERFLILAELESGTGYHIYQRRLADIADFGLVIAEAVANVAKRVETQNIDLHTELSTDIPCIRGDRVYLEIALRQLLDNAIKFTGKGDDAIVKLAVSADDSHLFVSVTDHGRGFDMAEREQLFDMFYQSNREEFEQQGVGAGLAIVRHVMTMHHGDILVDTTPGHGSTFTLKLPICP